jgi:hypothetical protein
LSTKFNAPISVRIPTLQGGTYIIRSFLGFLHVILHYSLPPDRTVKEYLEIFLLFTTLLSRVLSLDLQSQQAHHTKIALMVCLATKGSKARAEIGFNATAPSAAIQKQIHADRRRYLDPVLNEIQSHDLGWGVGHCAEVEILAHLKKLREGFPGFPEKEGKLDGMVAVILVLDLKNRTALRACPQCRQLIWKIRKQQRCAGSVRFGLGPVPVWNYKGPRTELRLDRKTEGLVTDRPRTVGPSPT